MRLVSRHGICDRHDNSPFNLQAFEMSYASRYSWLLCTNILYLVHAVPGLIGLNWGFLCKSGVLTLMFNSPLPERTLRHVEPPSTNAFR